MVLSILSLIYSIASYFIPSFWWLALIGLALGSVDLISLSQSLEAGIYPPNHSARKFLDILGIGAGLASIIFMVFIIRVI